MRVWPVVVTALAALTIPASAAAAPSWGPDSAPIHPGVMTHTEGAQCTANFVFHDDADNVYLGQAAHCSGTGAATETDGCLAESLPLGTNVEVDGASRPGKLVYNSWITMQNRGESNADTCAYNDFALIKIDPADVGNVNPSIPFWGGPTGLTTTTAQGAKVLSYGNSSLRQGISQLSPKEGIGLGPSGGGWSHTVYTLTPGIPGDSGSAFIDKQGKAFGVLSTVAIAPLPASNGVGDLSRELAYARANSSYDVTLANGTKAFRGPLLPLP